MQFLSERESGDTQGAVFGIGSAPENLNVHMYVTTGTHGRHPADEIAPRVRAVREYVADRGTRWLGVRRVRRYKLGCVRVVTAPVRYPGPTECGAEERVLVDFEDDIDG